MIEVRVMPAKDDNGDWRGFCIEISGTAFHGRADNSIRSAERFPTLKDGQDYADGVFGLLDWGKGGQPPFQASVALDY